MKPYSKAVLTILTGIILSGVVAAEPTAPAGGGNKFDQEVALVREHVPSLILSDRRNETHVLVAPTLQGRVLTSTTGGANGRSFGWINFKLLADGGRQPHINAYGGEDRIWLGPEGGQFGLFFPPGAPFDFAHWQTPPPLDTEPFEVVEQRSGEVILRKDLHLVNYSGTRFDARIDRRIRILEPDEIWRCLKMPPQEGVSAVGFESLNRLTNQGPDAWNKSSGVLSIWILGMFNASPQTTVLIPYRQGPDSDLGQVVESDYFGSVPKDRLHVQDGIIYFRADARYRAKIGLSSKRALSVAGSYDPGGHVLTLIEFPAPDKSAAYVNSQWKMQEHPFAGSAVNIYNDGPNDTGDSLGNFYEMESSSPALALAPGKSADHFQRTLHLYGPAEALKTIARAVLGTDQTSFP